MTGVHTQGNGPINLRSFQTDLENRRDDSCFKLSHHRVSPFTPVPRRPRGCPPQNARHPRLSSPWDVIRRQKKTTKLWSVLKRWHLEITIQPKPQGPSRFSFGFFVMGDVAPAWPFSFFWKVWNLIRLLGTIFRSLGFFLRFACSVSKGFSATWGWAAFGSTSARASGMAAWWAAEAEALVHRGRHWARGGVPCCLQGFPALPALLKGQPAWTSGTSWPPELPAAQASRGKRSPWAESKRPWKADSCPERTSKAVSFSASTWGRGVGVGREGS